MAKKKGLGRGLKQLTDEVGIPGVALGEPAAKRRPPAELPLSAIDSNPFQPRAEISAESLKSLVESIEHHGVVEPVLVRPIAGDRYQLVAGQRRLAAARQVGLATIPAVVQDLTDEQVLVLSLVENLQREDLSPVDEARAFQLLTSQFGFTHDGIARAVGRGRSYVSNSLRLLGLGKSAVAAMAEGRISRGQGVALLAIPASERAKALAQALAGNLTVREIEQIARRSRAKSPKDAAKAVEDPYIRDIVSRLEEILSARVRVKSRGKGGEIVISYSSHEDLNRLLKILQPTENPF